MAVAACDHVYGQDRCIDKISLVYVTMSDQSRDRQRCVECARRTVAACLLSSDLLLYIALSLSLCTVPGLNADSNVTLGYLLVLAILEVPFVIGANPLH